MLRELRIVSLSPTLIVVGSAREIVDLMITPERAQYALSHARIGLAHAWWQLDRECDEPDSWAVGSYPEFWSQEARVQRWLGRCRSVVRWAKEVRKWEAKLRELEERHGSRHNPDHAPELRPVVVGSDVRQQRSGSGRLRVDVL